MFSAAPLLLLAGCGGAGGGSAEPQANSVEELENRLEALADRTTEDIKPPEPRLAFLKRADVGPELRSTPACHLHRDGKMLLVVNARGAAARVDGRRVALAVAGPVGPSGGFFTAPGVTVSIGRPTPDPGDADRFPGSWQARVTIGGDKERPIEKQEARWSCIGYSETLPPGR
jgi:hypothetical protein